MYDKPRLPSMSIHVGNEYIELNANQSYVVIHVLPFMYELPLTRVVPLMCTLPFVYDSSS